MLPLTQDLCALITSSNMFVKLLIVFLFLSNNAIASPAAPHPQDAVITAGPKLDIRQQVAVTDPRFMGWEVVGGSSKFYLACTQLSLT